MTTPPLRIALLSAHASPLAAPGSAGANGQHIHVAQVAQALAAAGHQVDMLTRRDDPALPAVTHPWRGVRVLHLDAGPPTCVRREGLLQHMPAFAEAARRLLSARPPYDVLHAHFFMSGWVGMALRLGFGVPLVTSFHALGLVRRDHPHEVDPFPPARIGIERALALQSDRVVAACPQEAADLVRLYGAPLGRIRLVRCGVDQVRQQATWAEVARQLGAAYAEVAQPRPQPVAPRRPARAPAPSRTWVRSALAT